jgi:hypothetical protein
MPSSNAIDGAIVQWGDRLFYPGNRIVRAQPTPRLRLPTSERARLLRTRIAATAVRRAPQVMVKVTGGGRGMKAIVAHFRYISKNGHLEIEEDQGNVSRGRDALKELADDWRHGGSLIPEASPRREAFNIILSMPRGVGALIVQRAAREFAKAEFADHKYVMVLHDHQAHPHVHLSVRAESKDGRRLNPRKTDLHRWRETFAEKLRGWGIDAEATRQPTRGVARHYESIWRLKANADGRLRTPRSAEREGNAVQRSRSESLEAWRQVAAALGRSGDSKDQALGAAVARYFGTRGREPGKEVGRSERHVVVGPRDGPSR